MWSGLLPPGLNESDVDTSSDEEQTLDGPGPILKKEREQKDFKCCQIEKLESEKPEDVTENKSASATVADEVQESQACPSGVSLDMWNKFQSLQKKNFEIKIQVKNQRDKGQKRKRSRKAKLKESSQEITESQQPIKENQLKELTQYFGINDRFKPLASKEALPKSGLEISIDRSLAEGDIEQAEELSDRLATREESRVPPTRLFDECQPDVMLKVLEVPTQNTSLGMCRPSAQFYGQCLADADHTGVLEDLEIPREVLSQLGVKIAKAVACRNFVKGKQDAEASLEARKKKKLAWGFEAKKRWETKSNMGYM